MTITKVHLLHYFYNSCYIYEIMVTVTACIRAACIESRKKKSISEEERDIVPFLTNKLCAIDTW